MSPRSGSRSQALHAQAFNDWTNTTPVKPAAGGEVVDYDIDGERGTLYAADRITWRYVEDCWERPVLELSEGVWYRYCPIVGTNMPP